MQNVFSKCKQPWNMFEMGRSNALIRIRWGTHCTHFKIERTTAQKHTLPPSFLKLKQTSEESSKVIP